MILFRGDNIDIRGDDSFYVRICKQMIKITRHE